jgi:hypothetical protein
MEAIDAYLFGGTVFRYATIFGTGFSTTAFVEALAAGARNESFPLRGILLATREKYPSLKRARRQVAALESDTDDSWGGPTTAGGQQRSPATEYRPRHPLDHERPLDIDHIYASALASRMHEASNWRKHHPERWWVNTIGNMWLLDAGTNRALRDQKPQVKFGRLEDWLLATPMTHQVWPTAQWSMTDSEIRRFIEVDTGLDHNINRAMKKFARLVEARADRLLDAPFGMLPDARLFARDAALEPRDDWRPTDGALSKELAERLKLTNVLGRLEEASPPQHSERARAVPETPTQPVSASARLQSVLAHADTLGQRGLLEELLAAGAHLGLYARPYAVSVMFTPATNKTRTLFTVSPNMGGIAIWVSADAFAEFFPEISADDAQRQLGPADEERLLDQTAIREFIAGLDRLLHLTPPLEASGA